MLFDIKLSDFSPAVSISFVSIGVTLVFIVVTAFEFSVFFTVSVFRKLRTSAKSAGSSRLFRHYFHLCINIKPPRLLVKAL